MPIERTYANCSWHLQCYVLTAIVSKLVTVETCLILTFRTDRGQTWISQLKCHLQLSRCWQLQCISNLSQFAIYQIIHSRNVHDLDPWSWPSERAKVKRQYANWNSMYDFLFTSNCNVFPICQRLRDILVWCSNVVHWNPWSWKLVKDIDDFAENWRANSFYSCTRLPKSAFLELAFSYWWHFVADLRTYIHTCLHTYTLTYIHAYIHA